MSDDKIKMEFEDFAVESMKYKTLLTDKFKNRVAYKPSNPNLVYSVLPGTILDIMIKEGDHIAKGDALLSYEAMKMHNIMLSPVNGKIKNIHVKIGEKVAKKVLLLEIE